MLEKERAEIIRIALDAQRSGLCKHKSGNFSIRDPKSGCICVTPAGMDREKLRVEDVSVLSEDLVLLEGLKPSSETMVHLEVYKACPNVNAISHTHSKFATAFAVLCKPIPAITYELAGFKLHNAYIPVAAYARPGSVELAQEVARASLLSDLILLEKHGAIAMGATLEQAYLGSQYTEEMAEIYYYTLMINQHKEPDVFASEELQSWQYPKFYKEKVE